ncbi:hypothetical protein LCGC14_0533290 [marine sediment metagenome]|uniref:Uncharacterized protein n=1 Tax=marine sediment metagenome TaxID=412755 RepID=A0A0F9RZN3_9ZZZZ
MSRRNRKSGRRTGAAYVLPQVGITTDGKRIIGGVYEFHETYGMPLQGLFCWLADRDMVPDWINFYHEACRNNMKHDRIMTKLRDPLEDAWGTEFADVVCDTLTKWKALQNQDI